MKVQTACAGPGMEVRDICGMKRLEVARSIMLLSGKENQCPFSLNRQIEPIQVVEWVEFMSLFRMEDLMVRSQAIRCSRPHDRQERRSLARARGSVPDTGREAKQPGVRGPMIARKDGRSLALAARFQIQNGVNTHSPARICSNNFIIVSRNRCSAACSFRWSPSKYHASVGVPTLE